MRAPVHSQKHYVQTSLSSTGAGPATATVTILDTELPQNVNAVNEVVEGAVVKAIYVEYWLINSAASIGSFTFTVTKFVGNDPIFTDAEMASLGTTPGKKNILFTSQGLLPRNSTFPMNAIRTWIKIPKSKQRFGLNDRIAVQIRTNTTDDLNFCGFALYKEYT